MQELQTIVSILTGTKNGVYSRTTGAGYNWGYAGDFENSGFTSNFIVGVKGAILSSTEYNNGRSFGIMGVGGYATNGWNYGVFGRLQGSKYGAGVYGTSNPTDNGTYVDGKYAGYFNGNTKVVGDLTVTGTVKGLVLGQAATVSSQQRSVNSVEETICDKLSLLSAVGYYKEVPVRSVNVMVGDTLVEEQAPTLIEMQDLSKKH